jgi:hypothetical protein
MNGSRTDKLETWLRSLALKPRLLLQNLKVYVDLLGNSCELMPGEQAPDLRGRSSRLNRFEVLFEFLADQLHYIKFVDSA